MSSDDFNLWQSEGVEYRGRVNNGDGTEIVRFRINDSVRLFGKSRFLRLSVSENP